MDRRQFMTASGLALGGLIAGGLWRPGAALPAPPSAGWDDAAYWAFMDRVQERMEKLWRASTTAYWPSQSMAQANMLLVHATAALTGHQGPARQDERARALAQQLCRAPWFAELTAPPGDQYHVPGWIDGGIEHLVVDEQVVSGLTAAWRARSVIGLTQAEADRIAQCIIATTMGRYWRWPSIRLNQISWYCRMYVSAVTVGGPRGLLLDLMRQVRRFLDQAERPGKGHRVSNLGPGYRFRYLPDADPGHPFNLDSPEYGNLTLGFMHAYADARKLGMGALDGRRAAIVRAWAARALCGYWTHAGYLNWDTGLGFKRWHQSKKVGLAQQGLLGIATCPELRPSGGYGAWSKYLLDAGFDFFDRQLERADVLPPANFYGVPSEGENPYSQSLAASRFAANAAKAVLLGLGRARSKTPPPLYAYDPDVGRLAVTTPHYNTAVVPSSRNAFPYGGLDVARLFDGKQDPAANIGGAPPASFGMVVRDGGGKVLLESQRPVRERRGIKPLRLTKAPRGDGARLVAYPSRPYAGPFSDLRASATVHARSIRITVSHRFTERWIETRWRMRKTGSAALRTEVLLPSTGPDVTVTAVLAGGARRTLRPGSRLRLARVRYLHVQGPLSGYVAVPRSAPAAATVELLRVARQRSAPDAGPTIRIGLARRSRAASQALTVRYAPVADAAEAARLAHRLA